MTRETASKLLPPNLLLEVALSLLPLHAEEDPRRDVLSEKQLVASLTRTGATTEAASALVHVLRRQFEALALLDQIELRSGNWAFVSYPASLVARSWLTTLSTPGQTLLQPDYWEQGDAKAASDKEEQRALLHRVETGRVRFNSGAAPIRVVHVAWGIIRTGDMFLLYRREDIDRPGEKSHVFPGGRFKLSDLPAEVQARGGILGEVFRTDSTVVAEWIKATLERELHEELDLLVGKHYTYAPWGGPLPLYCEVNGAGNRHAYSAYRLFLYTVRLTSSGETHLLHRAASSGDLAWLSAEEIAAPQRADGPSAYVDALRHAWGDRLKDQLGSLPDSRCEPYVFDLTPGPKGKSQSDVLHLPASPSAALRFGKPGHERPVYLSLDAQEWALLMLLGWHARGFLVTLSELRDVRLFANGWADVSRSVVDIAGRLIEKLSNDEGRLSRLVEIREGRFVALRASPKVVFFGPELFLYRIEGGSDEREGLFRLERGTVRTPWGALEGAKYQRPIKRNIVRILRQLEQGSDPDQDGINAGDWAANLRQQLLADVNRLGMGTPWSTANDEPGLAAGLGRIPSDSP